MRTKTYYMPDVGEKFVCTAKDSLFKGHVIRIDEVFDDGIGCKGWDLSTNSPVSLCDGMDADYFSPVMG